MWASFALLGTVLTGLAVMLGVMYWQPPYVGLRTDLACVLGVFGFLLTVWASFQLGDS